MNFFKSERLVSFVIQIITPNTSEAGTRTHQMGYAIKCGIAKEV